MLRLTVFFAVASSRHIIHDSWWTMLKVTTPFIQFYYIFHTRTANIHIKLWFRERWVCILFRIVASASQHYTLDKRMNDKHKKRNHAHTSANKYFIFKKSSHLHDIFYRRFALSFSCISHFIGFFRIFVVVFDWIFLLFSFLIRCIF